MKTYELTSVQNCMAYLNHLYEKTSGNEWRNCSDVFNIIVENKNLKKGFEVIPYFKYFKMPVRIRPQLFDNLKIMNFKKVEDKIYVKWLGDKPQEKMVIEVLKAAYDMKKGINQTKGDDKLEIRNKIKNLVNQAANHTQDEISADDKKMNNMNIIRNEFMKINKLFLENTVKFDVLNKKVGGILTNMNHLPEIIEMIYNRMGNNDENLENLEKIFNEFKKYLFTHKRDIANQHQNLINVSEDINDIKKTIVEFKDIVKKANQNQNIINMTNDINDIKKTIVELKDAVIKFENKNKAQILVEIANQINDSFKL